MLTMSLRWLSYIATQPSNGGSKTQNGSFLSNIALPLKKVCYKVSMCINCQRLCYKAFIGLTICAKIIGGEPLLYLKFWVKLTALERNRRFLANVNACSRSLYVVVRPSVCRLSVCLSSVCNVRAPYSADWNFRQCFCAI